MARAPQRQAARDDSADDESLLVAAMANTESEIFAEAMGDEEPENDGDTSLEKMDDPVGEEEDAEGGDDELNADAGDDTGDDDAGGEGDDAEGDDAGGDQSGEPRRGQAQDRDGARQQQEGRRYTLPPVDPSAARIAELEARLARVEAPRADQRQEQAPATKLPDPVLDPEGYQTAIETRMRSEFQEQIRVSKIATNFEGWHSTYIRENRREEFELAAREFNELSNRAKAGDRGAIATVTSIMSSPDQGYAMIEWAERTLDMDGYRQELDQNRIEQAARLLGVDPADLEGFAPEPRQAQQRERRQEARQDRTSPNRARGEQRQQPAPRGGRRLPSLNSAGGVGREGGNSRTLDPNGFDGSEESIFTFATR